MALFRSEALTAQTDRLHGDIMLARPLSAWLLAWEGGGGEGYHHYPVAEE